MGINNMKLQELIKGNDAAKKLGLIVESYTILRNEKCIKTESWYRPTNGEWNFIVPQIKVELHNMGVQRYPIGQGKARSLFSKDKTQCLLNSYGKQYQILIRFYPYFSEMRVRNEAKKKAGEIERISSFTGLLLVRDGYETWSAKDHSSQDSYTLARFSNGVLRDKMLLYAESHDSSSGDMGYGCPPSHTSTKSGDFESLDLVWDFLRSLKGFETYADYTRDNGEYEDHESTLGSKFLVKDMLISQL